MIVKTAIIVKRKGKWCVLSHRPGKNGKRRNFGCYENKEDAKKRLGQIQMFKHRKGELIETIISVADELTEKGIFHIADALSGCIETISKETIQNTTIIKIAKIVVLLQKKGENDNADRIDSLLPEIICLENCECDADDEQKNRMTADRVYKIAKNLNEKYKTGLIDDGSFEYARMEELESSLKMGFLLPPPEDCKELPTGYKNWWEYFNGK